MADMSFLRAELHEQSGRNRSYYRGGNPGVNGGRPLQPLGYRTVRDELLDGNRRQDQLMAKLMQAYEGIEQGAAVEFREPSRQGRRPLRLPGVVRKQKQQEQELDLERKPATAPAKSSSSSSKANRPKPSTAPQQRRRAPGPQTVAKTDSLRTALLAKPKRNAVAEKVEEQRFLTRKLNAKPKRTAADKALAKLEREADGLRVCLNKIGPKGRGLTLFVMLTGGTTLTIIAADNTRGLKYRLRLTADAELADKGVTEKMHVLHALAVAVKISEVPKEQRKGGGGAKKKADSGNSSSNDDDDDANNNKNNNDTGNSSSGKQGGGDGGGGGEGDGGGGGGGSGWGNDLRLDVDPEIMVAQMSRPRNLNPEEEIDAAEREDEEVRRDCGRGGGSVWRRGVWWWTAWRVAIAWCVVGGVAYGRLAWHAAAWYVLV